MILGLYSVIFEVLRRVLLLDDDPVLPGHEVLDLRKRWLVLSILEAGLPRKGKVLSDRGVIHKDFGIVREEDEELSVLFQPQASYLQLVLHGQVIVGKIDAELVFFLAFLQLAEEEHFFYLLVGKDVLEMAHAAVDGPYLLLHALEMVGVPTVDADKGVFLACYFLLAEAQAKRGQVFYVVNLGVAWLVLLEVLFAGGLYAAGLGFGVFLRPVGTQYYHLALRCLLAVFLLRLRVAHIHKDLHVLLFLCTLVLALQFFVKVSLKDPPHKLRHSVLYLLTLLEELLRDFLNRHVFVDPADVEDVDGLIETGVDVLDRRGKKALAELFEVLFVQPAVNEVLEYALVQFFSLLDLFAALHGEE